MVAALGFLSGVGRLGDNSFLTHLATGRLIWSGSGFPRVDPYTFTAAGEAWYPQSWLASLLYAAVEDVGGATALRLQFAATGAALGLAAWVLTRPAGHVGRRLLAVTPVLLTGLFGWSHRPYLLAYLCLAGVLCVAEGALDRRWLLPIGWVWLNVHGSWPFGLAVLAVSWIGRRLDGEDRSAERSALTWLAGGLALGCLNPYGPRLLTFPAVALERREVFSAVREWQPPTFDDPGQLAFLAVVALAVVGLRLRPTWHGALMVVAFAVAALLSVRNIHVAAFALVPVTAHGLRGGGPTVPPLLRRAAPVVAAATVAVGLAVAVQSPDYHGDRYPVAATRWLAANGLSPVDHRVVAQDFVGNWLEWQLGDRAAVFIDDRFEVIPTAVVEDYVTLLRGEPEWRDALDRYEPDAVLWERSLPLASLLAASPCWDVRYDDDSYVVAVPSNAACR